MCKPVLKLLKRLRGLAENLVTMLSDGLTEMFPRAALWTFDFFVEQAPLAVVGSNTVVEEGEGKKVWGRR